MQSSQFLIEVGNGKKKVSFTMMLHQIRKLLWIPILLVPFVNDDYIVLCDIDMKNLYLFNRKGELLDKTALEHMEGLPQGIIITHFILQMEINFIGIRSKDKFQSMYKLN